MTGRAAVAASAAHSAAAMAVGAEKKCGYVDRTMRLMVLSVRQTATSGRYSRNLRWLRDLPTG
jgi:hypothetical protein